MASILPCPICGEHQFYQSQARNIFEKLRNKYLFQNAYRCHQCGYRTWIQMPIGLPHIKKRHLAIFAVILLLSFLISHMLISVG